MHKVLIDRKRILRRVRELGAAISRDYAGEELVVVAVLKGAAIFVADLLRHVTIPVSMEFMEVCSYDGTESTSNVRIIKDLQAPVAGKNLLLVEDIVDTGLTLSYLAEHLRARNPRSLRICALLDKPDRRLTPVTIDYLGFSIPNKFVVGYGLDYQGRYRNLPDVLAWTVISDIYHE